MLFFADALLSRADGKRDPLTSAEIDQLRDTAQEPDLRLKLYVNLPGPGWRHSTGSVRSQNHRPRQATHDRLQDFLDVYDELNENIDTYVDRKADLRKVLKIVIEADTEFQAKLRALRDDATAKKEEQSNTNSCSPTRSKPSTAAPRTTASC